MEVFEIDDRGYIIENYIKTDENTRFLKDKNIVEKQLPQPLHYYKPRWNGTEWVEGETAEEKAEREAQQMLESLKPSQNEIENAELEIKMITMLTEMGVIQ